jgi:hypothetical protein
MNEIMSNLAPEGKVYQAGTLSGNPIAMAAGLETIKTLYNNPSIFESINNKKNGKGKLIYSNKTETLFVMYNGDWVDDKREGKGVFINRKALSPYTEDIYDGNFINNKMNGKGRMFQKWKDTFEYEGTWSNNTCIKCQTHKVLIRLNNGKIKDYNSSDPKVAGIGGSVWSPDVNYLGFPNQLESREFYSTQYDKKYK